MGWLRKLSRWTATWFVAAVALTGVGLLFLSDWGDSEQAAMLRCGCPHPQNLAWYDLALAVAFFVVAAVCLAVTLARLGRDRVPREQIW